jgi:glycosidase
MRVFFTSNHDENSHSGTEYERMGDAARPFAVLCAAWGGIPLLYSGQEIPMINKRLYFFDKDLIPWKDTCELHEFYKTLLTLRLNNPALRTADPDVRTYRLETTRNADIFAWLRKKGEREVVVILNLSSHDQLQFDIIGSLMNGVYLNIFSGVSKDLGVEKTFVLDKWEYLVFEK